MRIEIIHFKVKQAYCMTEDINIFEKAIRWMMGIEIKKEYHFDCLMKVDPNYEESARRLEVNDFVELPNRVRLKVWRIDRDTLWAKTCSYTIHDLRTYLVTQMYLVYPRVHGRINS